MEPILRQSYAAAVPELSVDWSAERPPRPALVQLQGDLARELGFDPEQLRTADGIRLLTGDLSAGKHDSGATEDRPRVTTAQVYAGFQFGQPSSVLGDGRAVLLGDLVDRAGRTRDLHLKGSGRTPFSRGGDGKAPLGPMLRELLVGEAMHALGIPTTRALAVIATGEQVQRRRPGGDPGAILVRTAASHLRVGTFQYAAWHHGPEVLGALTDYAISRHWPEAAGAERPALELLRSVIGAQARLVAQWMLVGFVHGVMNTDNMTISGETIDYGPCAFLDAYRADAVFSSIDHGGRYAYGNQPQIALWNLARFAETLLPLIDPDDPDRAVDLATEALETFTPLYEEAWARGMAAKVGVTLPEGAGAQETARALVEIRALAQELLGILEAEGADFTGSFRALADGGAAGLRARLSGAEQAAVSSAAQAAVSDAAQLADSDAAPPALDAWCGRRDALRAGSSDAQRAAADAAMLRANPVHIPRNRPLQAALDAAEDGDLAPFTRMLEAVTSPFEHRAHLADLAGPGAAEGPGAPDAGEFVTYCGT
ncbi:YdiU family protein [Brachybacterium sp. JHP9]|uniref:Protein nucleotidyltransferase YdiU n=1 Tax=Brachybacterium equifaecis TaxID=2910770 RepID=A0ABT0R2K4_9MICO|nr:YdiU family protein [Brachybacterium equifaecis]MCL6423984.1 YdiU family protein [Brachybacterium equifaecis]